MSNRKSVSLSTKVRNDMFHSFFMKITSKPRAELQRLETELAMKIYNLVFGKWKRRLSALPAGLVYEADSITTYTIIDKSKRNARKKGSIEPSNTKRYRWRRFVERTDLGSAIEREVSSLTFDDNYPVDANFGSWRDTGENWWAKVIKSGICEKEAQIAAEHLTRTYCLLADDIFDEYIPMIEGVREILTSRKSTKTLLEAWPEAGDYFDLPIASAGELMKVDVATLNKSLASKWPKEKAA